MLNYDFHSLESKSIMNNSEKARKAQYLVLLSTLVLLIFGGIIYLKYFDKQANRKPLEKEVIPFSPTPFNYESKHPGRGGTGKVYMGREISHVMGHQAINWLERGDREDEEAPSKAVKGLELKPDAVVADIGSGSGYYTFRIAPLVPDGMVIGVDIQPEMVAFLNRKAKQMKAENVKSHLGKIDSVELPHSSIDAVIMVDAYHEFSHPNEMMQSIFHALKPGGRVYLLEYRAEDPDVPIKTLHKMTEAQSIAEMEAVGFSHVRTEDFLPWQHFMVFEK